MFVRIGGRRMYLWRAVDDEGEVLDLLIQPRRDQKAARKLVRKLLKRHGFAPNEVVTDKLPSYAAAFRDVGLLDRHRTGWRLNNRAENSHLPVRRRERAAMGFRSPGSAPRFLSVHADVYNHFNLQRHLISRRTLRAFRDTAFAGWRDAVQAG